MKGRRGCVSRDEARDVADQNERQTANADRGQVGEGWFKFILWVLYLPARHCPAPLVGRPIPPRFFSTRSLFFLSLFFHHSLFFPYALPLYSHAFFFLPNSYPLTAFSYAAARIQRYIELLRDVVCIIIFLFHLIIIRFSLFLDCDFFSIVKKGY